MAIPGQGASTSLKLSEILLREKLVTQEQLDKAVELQKRSADTLDAALIKSGAVSDKDMVLALSQALNLPSETRDTDLLTPATDQNLNQLLTEEFCRKNHVLQLVKHANALRSEEHTSELQSQFH